MHHGMSTVPPRHQTWGPTPLLSPPPYQTWGPIPLLVTSGADPEDLFKLFYLGPPPPRSDIW